MIGGKSHIKLKFDHNFPKHNLRGLGVFSLRKKFIENQDSNRTELEFLTYIRISFSRNLTRLFIRPTCWVKKPHSLCNLRLCDRFWIMFYLVFILVKSVKRRGHEFIDTDNPGLQPRVDSVNFDLYIQQDPNSEWQS